MGVAAGLDVHGAASHLTDIAAVNPDTAAAYGQMPVPPPIDPNQTTTTPGQKPKGK